PAQVSEPDPPPWPRRRRARGRSGRSVRPAGRPPARRCRASPPPEPVPPPAAGAESQAPKGTDALRAVFQGDPTRAWSLAELLEALDRRGWLTRSRRPEEGVRISLKRLVERGGAVRTPSGGWQLPPGHAVAPPEPPVADPAPPPLPEPVEAPGANTPSVPTEPVPGIAAEPVAGPAQEKEVPTPPSAPAFPRPGPRVASFGRPVGATISEL
ncbi:MAG: hypothetical protein ABIS47_04340, partial [Acidimicrobiales bacterium]